MPGFPPYSEQSLQYYFWGLCTGFLRPEYEIQPLEVPEGELEPYYVGIQHGEDYGANGYPIDTVCIDLSESHNWAGTVGHATEFLIEAGGIIRSLVHVAVGAAAVESGILALMLAIAAPTHYYLPTQTVDTSAAMEWIQMIQVLPEPMSVELYFGGGIDYNAGGCQLQMGRIYKSYDQCRETVLAMERPSGMIFSLRTDMSGGLRVVEQWGEIL